MKIKTSDLVGKALEYCVIKLERPKLKYGKDFGEHHASDQIVVLCLPSPSCYSPYSSWEFCGPIIEREGITVARCIGDLGEPSQYWVASIELNHWEHGYGPYHEQDEERSIRVMNSDTVIGETPLIAAMRCYVANKMGGMVDVPDDLL